ncbi:hypothetical protein AJ80_06600 [Polytolypa hystricis UAMH7299]|uniref:Uncharacterized protein n=1 Tax=Polytolypa hystricis (strain UAMH7299) TaxID=1447883 RepID=A0A2B7XU93_POLH7|nr:hypothetical protein AJ80_06600 [Polytolypa hystricis UAMH7299]
MDPSPASPPPRASSRPLHSSAPIELLPVELIQKIFFDCLDVNFPRASPTIAAALSNPIIYTWLIRLAFSSNNESSNKGFFITSFLPLNYFSLDTHERAALQTKLLECRWCTIPLIRKCQREYIEHVLQQKCSTTQLNISADDRAHLTNLDTYFQAMDRFDTAAQGKRGRGDLVLPAHSTTTSQPYKISIWFNFGTVQIREPSPVYIESDVFRLPCCSFAEPCRMPDKLLRPPFTDEKLEFLTLLSTEAYIDEDNTYRRCKAVLRQVIQDRDIHAFERLLDLNVRVKVYGYPLRWPVRPNHFRLAARFATNAENHDDPFLKLLFTKRRDDVPKDDGGLRALMGRYDRRASF